MSKTIIVNIGVPQGTILSPLFFSLYIRDFKIQDSYFNVFKYADDMALVGRLSKAGAEVDTWYYSYINLLQNWCKLEINVDKTKELSLVEINQILLKGLNLILDGHQIEMIGSFK